MLGSQFMKFNFKVYKALYCFSSGASYESIITALNGASSVREVLDQYRRNQELFKTEHTIQGLRIIGRYSRGLYNDIQQEEYKQAYSQLLKQLEENIEQLNEQGTYPYRGLDLTDVLFWMRRLRVHKLNIGISQEHQNLIHKKIQDAVQNKQYNFRNLVNIYFDMSLLGRSVDFLLEPLKAVILQQEDKGDLTPFAITQLLQGAAKRNRQVGAKELILVNQVLRRAEQQLSELDLDQKSAIFKYVSQIELQYRIPSFKVPPLMNKIKESIVQNIENLSEYAVLNIVNAYEYLPNYYQSDLIEEIKQMVSTTIEHNSNNLKNSFLLDYAEVVTKQTFKRKYDGQRLEKLIDDIANRFSTGDLPNSQTNLDRAARIFQRVKPSAQALDKYQKTFEDTVAEFEAVNKINVLSFQALDYLTFAGRNINNSLKSLESINIDKLNYTQKVRLYTTLQRLNQEEYSSLKENVFNSLMTSADKYADQIILTLENGTFTSSEAKGLLKQLGKKLRENLTSDANNRQLKSIFVSIVDREEGEQWNEWLSKADLNQRVKNRLLEEFNLDDYSLNYDNILFFLNFVNKFHKELAPSRFFNSFVNNNKIVNEINRSDQLFRKLFETVKLMKEARPNEVKLADILGLCLRFDGQHQNPSLVRQVLKRAYELTPIRDGDAVYDAAFIMYMIKCNAFTENDALTIAHKFFGDKRLRTSVLALANQSDKIPPQVETSITEIVRDLGTTIQNTNLTYDQHFSSIQSILQFRPSQYEQYLNDILAFFDKNQTMSDKSLLATVQSIPRKWINDKNQSRVLQPLFKSLYQVYIKKQPTQKLNINERINILEVFVSNNIKNTWVLNKFLEEFGKTFNSVTPEYKVKAIRLLAKVQVRNQDVYEQVLVSANQAPKQYRYIAGDLLKSLFKVGVYTPEIVNEMIKLMDAVSGDLHNQDIIYALTILTLQGDQEQTIKRFIGQLKPSYKLNTPTAIQATILLSKIFKEKHPNESEQLLSIVSPEDITLHQANMSKPTFGQFKDQAKAILDAMKVKYQVDYTHTNGLPVDFYIPDQNISLVFVKTQDMNFDGETYSGLSQLKQTLYDKEATKFISYSQFRNYGTTPLEKVTFFESLGVTSNAGQQYDFSAIPSTMFQERKKYKKPRQQVAEDQEEE